MPIRRGGWHAAPTQPIPAVVPEPGLDQAVEQATEQTRVIRPVASGKPSLIRSTGSMAIATLVSRITGFAWKVLLAALIGTGAANDSFMVANNLPNSVFELLIGGVLTSVIVPVLVRAEKSDADGGQAYIQRLLTLSTVLLGIGTLLSVLAAPWLVALFMQDAGKATPGLATALAFLLLPQIFFYGISALLSAILQAKQLFSPPAWAPVVNNVIVLITLAVFLLLPGERSLYPASMTNAHLLTLGIGVTCGVLAQAGSQLPALRRSGFRFRWRWGWDPRLSEFGGLALWMVIYVLVSQVGLMAMSQVGTQFAVWSQYNYVWMLLQLPYGVIGFSVMTAILPRMSSAAADNDWPKVLDDLSLGNRMSTVALMPISAVMVALGVPLCLALFALGKSGGDAAQIGMGLALSSFGVLPYAITMMQMRVFYAMKDARTPALIMVVMTLFKVGGSAFCLMLETPQQVLIGITVVNSFSFVVGWLVGEVWLRTRLGPLGSKRLLVTLGKTFIASVIGGVLTFLLSQGIGMALPLSTAALAWVQLIFCGIIGLVLIFGTMTLLQVAELRPAIGRLTALLRRR